jgi:hypothetical protein
LNKSVQKILHLYLTSDGVLHVISFCVTHDVIEDRDVRVKVKDFLVVAQVREVHVILHAADVIGSDFLLQIQFT